MPCLLVILALLLPRVAMVIIWLFTRWFHAAFETWIWPVLGFIFMPYTTLAFLAAKLNTSGEFTLGWIILIVVAAFADFGHWGAGIGGRRRKRSIVI